ncbi:hypothetical protein LTR84_001230 [Exophiala bonariae]|uniref:S1/P1 Nuclease n=1 Tax=Exophiala bonariae TaxID=1690606 RepID=A0AAV9NW81_9EURO|nr:hypothetical protein LTR84_001230 [Exophiala bonariae]
MRAFFVHTALLVLSFSVESFAWGEHGHRTVGYLARLYFTPNGEALFNELLAPTAMFDISDGAVWADDHGVQIRMPFSKPWHYIDAKDDPPDNCTIVYSTDCDPDKHCVIAAIVNMTSRVNNQALLKQEQSNAFKFLLHFLGDVTQPLHTEEKCKGGNNLMVQWGPLNSPREKLHQVWDSLIIQKLIGYKRPTSPDPNNVYDKSLARTWAAELKTRIDAGLLAAPTALECININTPEKCALKWAGEANKLICSYVLKDGKNLGRDRNNDDCRWEWHGPEDVSKEYYQGAVPIVEAQIAKAGYRLGAWVNALAEQRSVMRRNGITFDEGSLRVQGRLDL